MDASEPHARAGLQHRRLTNENEARILMNEPPRSGSRKFAFLGKFFGALLQFRKTVYIM